jgi:hypothetical protein
MNLSCHHASWYNNTNSRIIWWIAQVTKFYIRHFPALTSLLYLKVLRPDAILMFLTSAITYNTPKVVVEWLTLLLYIRRRVSSGSIVSDYGLDDRAIGVRSPAGAKVFPLVSVSRPALGPTQPPVQWVPGVLSPGCNSAAGAWHWPLTPI